MPKELVDRELDRNERLGTNDIATSRSKPPDSLGAAHRPTLSATPAKCLGHTGNHELLIQALGVRDEDAATR